MSWYDDIVSCAKDRIGDAIREVLYGRGVSDRQIDEFEVGYLESGLPEGLDYPQEFLKWSAWGSKLQNVFVFPLTNTLGQIKGLQFRSVDRATKGYMDFIPDRSEAVLFGLKQAMPHIWETQSIYLVEGAFDLFPVQRQIPGTVATLTAGVPETLLRVLRRMVDVVWLGYDMDPPGRRACERFTLEHGAEFKKVCTVTYPLAARGVKDPADLWEACGDAQLVGFFRSLAHKDKEKDLFNA